MDEAGAAARSALDETRRSVLGLAPSPLEGRSLEEALDRELAWANRMGAADVRMVVAGEPVPLPTEVAHPLFRIAQEALTNALHHADARSVRIGIVYAPTGVSLLVQDDGAGFDLAEAERSGRPGRDRPARHGRAGAPARRHAGGRVDAGLGHAGAGARAGRGRGARRPRADAGCACCSSTTTRPSGSGIARLLADVEPSIEVVGQAGSGRQALVLWRALQPDVALMDLRMPDGDGVEAIVAIRGGGPRGRDRRADGLRQRRAGRRAPCAPAPAATSARTPPAPSSRGPSSRRPTAARCSPAARSTGSRPTSTATVPSRCPSASSRCSRCWSAALPDRQIADALSISVKTVEKHVGAILRKTGAQNRTEAALRAREHASR